MIASNASLSPVFASLIRRLLWSSWAISVTSLTRCPGGRVGCKANPAGGLEAQVSPVRYRFAESPLQIVTYRLPRS